ncbi:winged helix-turn-helix transcriptional regulator [Thiorhodococcus mannitoliphagus]|uniref:winged helix-turn-helix transcriptional regulator n=1 Tax=Thiorhodococcus mannitoliphagus TaxID=329406 RepID=UPI00197E95C8|nr:winged helix-turn-helix transcriptional regulator [Thiorhodococcus mannitoliphagus]
MLSDDDRLILRLVAEDGRQVATRVAQQLGVTRQAASGRLARLKTKGWLTISGRGASTRYALEMQDVQNMSYSRENLEEDVVWRDFFAAMLADVPDNVLQIWQYAVTEMVNNAIDHSGAETISVGAARNGLDTQIYVADDGEGDLSQDPAGARFA